MIQQTVTNSSILSAGPNSLPTLRKKDKEHRLSAMPYINWPGEGALHPNYLQLTVSRLEWRPHTDDPST